MPRAEIPEGLDRFRPTVVYRHSPPNYEAVATMQHDPEGGYIDVCNLAALHAHWLEQLKEELLSDAALCAFEMHGRTISMAPPGAVELEDLRSRMNAALASIPIEEGGDGDA